MNFKEIKISMPLLRIICWAIIFLTRIRFPPGVSIADILRKRYGNNDALAVFHKYQRTELKLSKTKLDLKFLLNCDRFDVIPRFLNFKVSNRKLRDSVAYRQCQRKLLTQEISAKRTKIKELSELSSTLSSNLSGLVSSLDLIHLKTSSDRENSRNLAQNEKLIESYCA